MSIITLFTKTAPTINGFEFDAVLEDAFEASVEFTEFPIESGANATDHGVILPFRWTLIGAVSNNPIRPALTDFTGVLTNILPNNGIITSIAGLSAGFISGSDNTRASETLTFLLNLMIARAPFDIDAGDIQLSNMVISDIARVKDPETENALVFEASLQELPTLDTVLSNAQPRQSQIREGDPAKSQIAASIEKGETALREVGDAVNQAVDDVIEALS